MGGGEALAALQEGDPQRIGPYVLLGRLGSGGMGRVYLARSPGGRMVAVKVIRAQLAEDAGFRARFAREVSAATKVGGLFTAQVVDADLNGAVPWLVTAYVPGTSLSEAVEQHGPLPAQSVLALAAGLAEGLSAIHAAGVIHRDLKPSNVLLAQDGPRIIDFGISSAAEATALTGTGFMIGSPGFMSPEQAEGLTVGPSSDIFSLAGLLIYAARGEGPFGSGDTAALLYRVVHGKPSIDQIPDDLRPLIKRSLSRDPTRRPTAPEFLAELSAVYPSAADLSDWLPPRILDLSARRDAAQQPSIAGTFGSGFGAEVPAFGSGAAAFEPGPASVDAAARTVEPAAGGDTSIDPPTRTSLAPPTPPPPTQVPPTPVPQAPGGTQGFAGSAAYPGGSQYPAPQGYSTGQGDPVAPGGSGIQPHPGAQGSQWWGGSQAPGGPSPGQPDQWYTPPPVPPGPRRNRPRWLLPVGGAAVVVVVVVALVLALGGNSTKTPTAGQSSTASVAARASQRSSPAANPTPTVGNLLLGQLRVGDCLTGSNMNLNKSTPWPKLTLAVPCSQSHTAEVFYANAHFWPKSMAYPGRSAINSQATQGCNTAFAAYDGITYSKSMYSWADVIADTSTWPNGDRALHCIAYYALPSQPAGAPITGSIRGSGK